jgi:Protein of unknown function DUF262/HNH endonuclease
MPTHRVNLDALIIREDFEVENDLPPPSQMATTLKISDLAPSNLTFTVLRKPDFQRETANWEPEKITEFVQSFLDGDLIPSIIFWRSPTSGNLFVIDGAHRLSALIAWVHDDYGDNEISRKFYDNIIPQEQIQAADKTRKLIGQAVGSYRAIVAAGQHPENSNPHHVRRARNSSAFAVQLQWVSGDAKKAEASFFKINQKATPIDSTELVMIKSRSKPNAVAARALLRAGVGHKYWSAFPKTTQAEIERIAREVYDILFTPVLEDPIKTLDLPVAGRGYSAESVKLVFEFVNFANGMTPKKLDDLKTDEDGTATLAFLKRVRTLSSRVSGTHPSSLGLHPAVYFYGATGRYQPSAFLATVRFIQELEQEKSFQKFTAGRRRFEEFLLAYRYFTNQIVSKYGSGIRSLEPLVAFYRSVLDSISNGLDDAAILAQFQNDHRLKFLKEMTDEDREYKKNFSRDTKSMAFLREALQTALRCKICDARIHKKAISVDHIVRKADGGRGNPENAQLTHPYCNTGYKEAAVASALKSGTSG